MNKKVLVIALAVAMLALPLSAVSATKPETMTLTGYQNLHGDAVYRVIFAGKKPVQFPDYNLILKSSDGGGDWIGGIEGECIYTGNSLWHRSLSVKFVGYWVFEEVTIAGRTGSLRIGSITTASYITGEQETKLWIQSGTGELSSIRGEGTAAPEPDVPFGFASSMLWSYELEIQINP